MTHLGKPISQPTRGYARWGWPLFTEPVMKTYLAIVVVCLCAYSSQVALANKATSTVQKTVHRLQAVEEGLK